MAVNKVLPLRAGPWHHSAGTNPVIKFLVKTMLRATFFEIFNIFLDKLTFEDLEILGLPDMERSTLEDYGYELVGDKSDCHAYEKEIIVPHRNTGLSLMRKLYFFADESVGTGLGVEPKVRLTTLLKAYWDYRDLRGGSLDNIRAVAGSECNTVIELKREHHAASPRLLASLRPSPRSGI